MSPTTSTSPVPQSLLDAIASGITLQNQGPVNSVKIAFEGLTAVVRYGPNVRLGEVNAMEWINQHAPPGSIPLAKILGVFSNSESQLYIVTEWIENSQSLDAVWANLRESDKNDILTQIRFILRTLRSLPTPESPYIGAVGRLPCYDPLLQDVGPFEDHDAFIQAYLEMAKPCFRGHYISIIERLLEKVKTYRIVLTHGDLASSNILVRQDERDRWIVVALVDWENSGWYPEHWEYVKMLNSVKWKADWALKAQSLLDQHYDEDFLLDSRLRLYHR